MTKVDPLSVASFIAGILDSLGINYVIGGSVASSLYGEPRSTLDLDLMIETEVEKTRSLCAALSKTCYVDEATAIDATRRQTSFNAIHLETSMKVDFFVCESASFAREAMANRKKVALPDQRALYFYAPEDLIIRKLLWFRLGGETSDRQWRDVAGIVRLNRGRLDEDRLRRTAREAGVADLLDEVLG